MSTELILELVGYAGSALIAISMMMRSVLRLRVFNLAGAVVLTIYALLIGAWPIVVLDGIITVVNTVQIARLLRERRERSEFDILEVDVDSSYLRRFVITYSDDIKRFQPYFEGIISGRAFLVLKDALVAGVVLVRPSDDDPCVGIVDLDYILPWHRDLQPARYVYEQTGLLHWVGFEKVVTRPGTDKHREYLRRVGYRPDGELYVKDLI